MFWKSLTNLRPRSSALSSCLESFPPNWLHGSSLYRSLSRLHSSTLTSLLHQLKYKPTIMNWGLQIITIVDGCISCNFELTSGLLSAYVWILVGSCNFMKFYPLESGFWETTITSRIPDTGAVDQLLVWFLMFHQRSLSDLVEDLSLRKPMPPRIGFGFWLFPLLLVCSSQYA